MVESDKELLRLEMCWTKMNTDIEIEALYQMKNRPNNSICIVHITCLIVLKSNL